MPFAQTNGIRTHYEDSGGDGPAVVLVHGHSLDLRMWRPQIAPLTAAGFRVIAHDYRGHGHTDAPASGYTWHSYAADLRALLDHLGVEKAHVVGCSAGGGVCLVFAQLFPERVASLTLVDSALPGFGYSSEIGETIQALIAAVRSEGTRPAFERLWLTHPLFDGARRFPDVFAELREMVLTYPATEYQEGYTGEHGYQQPDVAAGLDKIAVPALVIAGETDVQDFQLIAEILASAIPNARKHVFADAGHLPSMEHPAEFNALLIDFLRSV